MKSSAKFRLIVLFEIVAAFTAALVLPACGVESSTYIESIEQSGGAVTQVELTNKATVSLPGSRNDLSNPSQFGYWSILYRIYVSGISLTGQFQTSSGELSRINPFLASDYGAMYSFTDMTNNTIQSTSIYTNFKNYGYYEVVLEGVDNIADELDIFDKNLVIEFPQPAGSIPTLSITDKGTGAVNATYNLLRSTGYPIDGIHDKENNPLPSGRRYFINYDELNASANNSKTTNDGNSWNLDVADNSSAPASPRYTYVSLYIIALGRDVANSTWNLISSRPTFIAILRLPEKP